MIKRDDTFALSSIFKCFVVKRRCQLERGYGESLTVKETHTRICGNYKGLVAIYLYILPSLLVSTPGFSERGNPFRPRNQRLSGPKKRRVQLQFPCRKGLQQTNYTSKIP